MRRGQHPREGELLLRPRQPQVRLVGCQWLERNCEPRTDVRAGNDSVEGDLAFELIQIVGWTNNRRVELHYRKLIKRTTV